MKILLAISLMACPSFGNVKFLDNGKATEVVSIRFINPLQELPGAVGVPYFEQQTEHVKAVRNQELWLKFESNSVKALRPIDLMALRLRIVLSNGTQILMDENGRFIQTSAREKAVTKWKGVVRELRSSQFFQLIHEIQSIEK
jgi:hypothetical protein